MAKAVGRPWRGSQCRGGVAKAVGRWPRLWGRGQGRGGVAKTVGGGQRRGGVAKVAEARSRPRGRCRSQSQGVVVVAKTVERPWRRSQGRGGVAKAVGKWPRP